MLQAADICSKKITYPYVPSLIYKGGDSGVGY
jgi:hypothetical protein